MSSNRAQTTQNNRNDQVEMLSHIPEFSGNYSVVYKGRFRGATVAIKVIKLIGSVDSVKRKLVREIEIWRYANHKNIHPFYGHVTGPAFGQFGALVSPWFANGDACKFLAANGEQMAVLERINLWEGVIEGVAYLHNPVPTHRPRRP